MEIYLNGVYLCTKSLETSKFKQKTKTMKVTIYVDGQPEQFETSVPVSYCLITSTMDAPHYYTNEELALDAYEKAVKHHRDILATHKHYKFVVSLYEGTTLIRKTSK